MGSRSIRVGLAIAGGVVLLGACAARRPCGAEHEANLKEAARELDVAARYVEKWGSISISAPVVSVTGKEFRFDPAELTDDRMFENNRALQGFSRSSLETAVDLGAGVKVEPQLDAVPGPEEGTETPEPVEAPEPPDSAKSLLGSATEILTNPSTQPTFGTSQRQAIRQTASDRFELGLHKFLSNPADLPKDTRLVYLVLSVACQPGDLTQRGYIGQVDVNVEWDHCEDKIATNPPRIVAVYPSMDSQGLDLRTSRRELLAAAFSLAAAGKLVGASAFLNAASRSEFDAETFSSLTSVTSYSRGGQHFGFELRPAFFGKLDPDSMRARAGYRLEAVTFPVVVLMAVDRQAWDELELCKASDSEVELAKAEVARRRPDTERTKYFSVSEGDVRTAVNQQNLMGVAADSSKAGASPADEIATQLREERRKPRLRLTIAQSWRPLAGSMMGGPTQYLFAQDDILGHALNAQVRLDGLAKQADPLGNRARAMRSRGGAILAQLHPEPVQIRLPDLFAATPLRVDSVTPATGRAEQSNVFIIRGQGFTDGENDSVALELFEGQAKVTAATPFRIVGITEEMIAVAMDDGFSKSRHAGLTFRLTRDGESSFTPAFSISPAPEPVTKLTVTRDGAGHITGVAVPKAEGDREAPQLNEVQQIIEALKALRPEPKAEPKQGPGGTGGSRPGS